MMQFDEQLDNWLDQVTKVSLIHNMAEADQQKVTLIDSIVIQVAVEGYGKQPDEWTEDMLADLFFNRFVRLLDENEKQKRLFELIPAAVTALMDIVQPRYQSQLSDWIRKNHDQLVHLYDPVADHFYAKLSKAMMDANVDVNDQSAVAAFTQQYLRQHPDEVGAFFTQDD